MTFSPKFNDSSIPHLSGIVLGESILKICLQRNPQGLKGSFSFEGSSPNCLNLVFHAKYHRSLYFSFPKAAAYNIILSHALSLVDSLRDQSNNKRPDAQNQLLAVNKDIFNLDIWNIM